MKKAALRMICYFLHFCYFLIDRSLNAAHRPYHLGRCWLFPLNRPLNLGLSWSIFYNCISVVDFNLG